MRADLTEVSFVADFFLAVLERFCAKQITHGRIWHLRAVSFTRPEREGYKEGWRATDTRFLCFYLLSASLNIHSTWSLPAANDINFHQR